jgi:hypothetical protein
MSLLNVSFPVWVPVAGVIALLVALAVAELSKTWGVKCLLKDGMSAIWRALRNVRGEGEGRILSSQPSQPDQKPKRPFSLLIDFPRRATALLLLIGVSVVLFALSIGTTLRAPATFGFNASFSEANPGVIETNTAAPSVGMELPIHATVKPSGEQLAGAAVVITGPSTIVLRDCYVHTAEERIDGYAHGSQARISLAGLDSADQVAVECVLFVKRRIRHLETVSLKLMAADSSSTDDQALYLVPPDVELGQEKAEALVDKEVRVSPALWQRSSMRPAPGAFKEQGAEWSLLDPLYLHGFLSIPPGLTTTLHRLEDTRVQSSKIVTLSAVITSRPVTQERFTAKGSGRKAIRQVYAIGQSPGEKGGWCTTTRSTSQRPLREGDRLKLRAAVVEWGRSEESGGIAVMLNCPAVKIVGASDGAARASSSSGGASAPERPSH